MNDNNYRVEIDYLALGLTRSPMFMGANIKIFFMNIILCCLICLNASAFLGISLCIFIHLLIVKLSLKEPDFFSIYLRSFIKTSPVINRWYWGKTNSYEPW